MLASYLAEFVAETLRGARISQGAPLTDEENAHLLGANCWIHCRPPPHTMCPTAFLAPTLTAKTCFICTQPQNAFFLAQLALQGNRANGKKSLPGRVPGPKKGTKMVPNSGAFQEEFFLLSGQKKSQKLDRALP